MQRKTMSPARRHAALAAFVREQLGVEHRDDVGPWLGQAAWLDETYSARRAAERMSRRKIVTLLGELPGMPRRAPRQVGRHAASKRVVR